MDAHDCPICGEVFTDSLEWLDHLANAHGDGTPVPEEAS